MIDRRLAAGALIAACAIVYAASLVQLSASAGGVTSQYYPGDTPVVVLSPKGPATGTVVVAHGFAANTGMMKPLGYYLGQQGYRAVLFDFPGYGNSRLKVNDTSMQDALGQVGAAYGGDHYSLAGHSMGSYAVLSYAAQGHGDAVVGLSSFYTDVNLTMPRNMLLIAGTGDLATVVPSLPAAVANGTGIAAPAERTTYGNFSDGTARAYEYVNANHITILFDRDAWYDTARWLDLAYGHDPVPDPGIGGLSLSWAFIAIGAALVAFLPGLYLLVRTGKGNTDTPEPLVIRSLARPLLTALAGCAVAAIAVSLFNPVQYTGITMADRLIGFLMYAGLFTLAADYLAGRRVLPKYSPGQIGRSLGIALIAGTLLVVAIAIPMDLAFYEQPTTPVRLLLMSLVALLTFPFFVACDLLARGAKGWKSPALGAGIRVIALALAALAFAVAGNLFFVVIIMPVVVPLFLGLEAVAYYAYRWTGSVFAGAFLNALVTGWLLASAFPIA